MRVKIFDLFLLFEKVPYIHHSSMRERIYIIITFPPCKEILQYQHHCSSLQGKYSVLTSLFLLARKVFSNYTKLVTEAWSPHQQLAHWYSHTGVLCLPLVPYSTGFFVIFMQLWLSQRITVVSNSMSNSPDIIFPKPYGFPNSGASCHVLCFSCTESNTRLNHEIMVDPR